MVPNLIYPMQKDKYPSSTWYLAAAGAFGILAVGQHLIKGEIYARKHIAKNISYITKGNLLQKLFFNLFSSSFLGNYVNA